MLIRWRVAFGACKQEHQRISMARSRQCTYISACYPEG